MVYNMYKMAKEIFNKAKALASSEVVKSYYKTEIIRTEEEIRDLQQKLERKQAYLRDIKNRYVMFYVREADVELM